MASKVLAISASVRAEGSEERAKIIPNGNSHLVVWDESLRSRRQAVRDKFGWADKVVVLNVCRFRAGERSYKGLDKYADVFTEFQFARPKLAPQTVFALCGKADPADVAEMQGVGFEVFANLTDSEMSDFYLAADVYANFSRWEGFNLGIGQALALGLPVIASDIPAHRAFPIVVSSDTLTIIETMSEFVETAIEERFAGQRTPVIMDWKDSLAKFEHEIVELCGGAGALSEPKFARV